MLLLIFRAGESSYALDAGRVVEVVPFVKLRAIPHAPPFISGLLSYRDRVVPVIDFSVLVGASPSRQALSTRVVLIEFTRPDRKARLLGVVAESVSHVVTADPGQFVSPAMSLGTSPYLAEVIRTDEGLVQIIRAGKLLSDELQDALYGRPTEPG